jgi:hypothetical protein
MEDYTEDQSLEVKRNENEQQDCRHYYNRLEDLKVVDTF